MKIKLVNKNKEVFFVECEDKNILERNEVIFSLGRFKEILEKEKTVVASFLNSFGVQETEKSLSLSFDSFEPENIKKILNSVEKIILYDLNKKGWGRYSHVGIDLHLSFFIRFIEEMPEEKKDKIIKILLERRKEKKERFSLSLLYTLLKDKMDFYNRKVNERVILPDQIISSLKNKEKIREEEFFSEKELEDIQFLFSFYLNELEPLGAGEEESKFVIESKMKDFIMSLAISNLFRFLFLFLISKRDKLTKKQEKILKYLEKQRKDVFFGDASSPKWIYFISRLEKKEKENLFLYFNEGEKARSPFYVFLEYLNQWSDNYFISAKDLTAWINYANPRYNTSTKNFFFTERKNSFILAAKKALEKETKREYFVSLFWQIANLQLTDSKKFDSKFLKKINKNGFFLNYTEKEFEAFLRAFSGDAIFSYDFNSVNIDSEIIKETIFKRMCSSDEERELYQKERTESAFFKLMKKYFFAISYAGEKTKKRMLEDLCHALTENRKNLSEFLVSLVEDISLLPIKNITIKRLFSNIFRSYSFSEIEKDSFINKIKKVPHRLVFDELLLETMV